MLAIDDDIIMLTSDELQFGYEVREFFSWLLVCVYIKWRKQCTVCSDCCISLYHNSSMLTEIVLQIVITLLKNLSDKRFSVSGTGVPRDSRKCCSGIGVVEAV